MISYDNWEAGPGSYNISQDLAQTSSIYYNAPRPLIGKAEKISSISKSSLKSSPCPTSSYDPPSHSLFRSSSSTKFGHEKRKDYFLQSQDRSPGPIYKVTLKPKTGISFSKARKKDSEIPIFPSPNSYNPMRSRTKIAIKLKGTRSEKVYQKNVEKFLKGLIGPGPAEHSWTGKLEKGIKISRSSKESEFVVRTSTPGPGTYQVDRNKFFGKGHRFPAACRKLDIRACKRYIDRNSHEFFRF
jgi:hypothetical protein